MGYKVKSMQAYNKYERIFNIGNKQLWFVQGILDREDWELFNMKYVNQSLLECHISMNWTLNSNEICITKGILFCKRTNPNEMIETFEKIGSGKYITIIKRIETIQEYTMHVRQITEAQVNTPDEFKYETPHTDNSFRYNATMSTFPCDEVFEDPIESSQESLLRIYDDASLDDSFFNNNYQPMSIDNLLQSANHLLSVPDLSPTIDDLLKGVDYKHLL